jgi:2'-5' RNA ligase
MPFSYNEAKEANLAQHFRSFFANQVPFSLTISGIGNFGQRVIFQKIIPNPELLSLQLGLKTFCKRELHLVDELSDRNYHPHLTLAFRDLKSSHFEEVLSFTKRRCFDAEFLVDRVALLKKEEGIWRVCKELPLGQNF